MSQAVIDFCDGLKMTLLGIEDRLGKAKVGLESGATHARDDAKRHIEEASAQLAAFKAAAATMAAKVRAELPDNSAEVREKLTDAGAEAQVALRHAAVFLAEAAAKGAEGAASVLRKGAAGLRRETAVAAIEQEPTDDGAAKPA